MKKFFLIVIFALVFRLVLSFIVWHPDLNNHSDWGIRFFEYRASRFYSPETNVWSFTWPNQPPGSIYMFAGVRKLFEFVFNVFWLINVKIPAFPSIIVSYFETNLYPALLKLPAILSDFGIAYLIYKMCGKKWASVVWLLNPLVWYNSAVWGQYDAVINFLALLSFYLLTKKKLILGALFLALSLFTKASLLIFAPIWIIYSLTQKYKTSEFVKALTITLIVIVLLTLPFSNGNPIIWLYELYQKKVFTQQLHVITANAFNLWAGVAGIHERPDTLPFLGLTYQLWGYILFALVYIPLLFRVAKNDNVKTLVWMLALAAFASFTLLTNMHERYLYPLFPYLTILLGLGLVKHWYYWLITIISLLGMYNFWFTPKIDTIINFLSFGDRLTPRVLGFVLTIMFFYLVSLGLVSKPRKIT